MDKELIVVLFWLLFMLIALIRVSYARRKSLVFGNLFVTIFQKNSGPNPCEYSGDTIDPIEITDINSNLYVTK